MKNLVVEKLPMLCQIAKLPNDTNCQMIKLPNDRYTVSEFCPFKNFSVNIFPSKFLFCQYFSPTLHSHHLSFSPLPEQSDMMKRGEKCRIIFADIQVGSSPHLIRLSVEHLPILDHTWPYWPNWHPGGHLPTLDQMIFADNCISGTPPHTWSDADQRPTSCFYMIRNKSWYQLKTVRTSILNICVLSYG